LEKQPLVSVIIINYNGKKYLQSCFDALLRGTYGNIEIILVDNGSGDGSVEFVRNNYQNIRIVSNNANLGLAIASNKGRIQARGKYLFFFNNDTIADKELISNLVSAMEADKGIGIGGCSTYTYSGEALINSGVACDIFGYPYGKGEAFYVDAGIFIAAELFDKIGGFDEKMFLYGEDRDICWRVWLYGFKVMVIDGAKFYHDSACITDNIKDYRTSINKRYWSEFNALRSILKNYGFISLFFILPGFMAINALEVILFVFSGKFNIVKNVYFRSYRDNLKYLRETISLRSKIQKERKVTDLYIISHMNMVSGKVKLFLDMGVPKFNEQTKYAKT